MLEYYMPQASSYAAEIDNLIWLVTILVGFWFFAAEGMFFYLIFKYRRREGVSAEYITGDEHELKKWIHWPHWLIIFCDIFIIWGAVRVWKDIKQDIPAEAKTEIRIVAQQWAWSFVHPGADGVLDTADDIKTVDELRVRRTRATSTCSRHEMFCTTSRCPPSGSSRTPFPAALLPAGSSRSWRATTIFSARRSVASDTESWAAPSS